MERERVCDVSCGCANSVKDLSDKTGLRSIGGASVLKRFASSSLSVKGSPHRWPVRICCTNTHRERPSDVFPFTVPKRRDGNFHARALQSAAGPMQVLSGQPSEIHSQGGAKSKGDKPGCSLWILAAEAVQQCYPTPSVRESWQPNSQSPNPAGWAAWSRGAA
jgi:hypothetical protein